MATKNPLDFIPTEPGEKLLYSRANTTFHRSFEYCLAASERAVYLGPAPSAALGTRADHGYCKSRGCTLFGRPSSGFCDGGRIAEQCSRCSHTQHGIRACVRYLHRLSRLPRLDEPP